ncbi:hypothetical protein JTE90_007034 [Oedothorax gibbosus]|uniref:Uncharacterized protein n=1 Tax=Oedothorax gibbosus TaxID=931172 RepID=A0AAV6U739_9ARAC|nr:hypothetical protein JTE90_007034 [Oedothorax gibbosus]
MFSNKIEKVLGYDFPVPTKKLSNKVLKHRQLSSQTNSPHLLPTAGDVASPSPCDPSRNNHSRGWKGAITSSSHHWPIIGREEGKKGQALAVDF